MNIICISGKARHGKDTVGGILQEQLQKEGKRTAHVAYGDLVKFVAKQYFDWDGNKDEQGRSLLQWIGTDIVRHENPNYWVEFVIGILDLFYGCWDTVIITDCRFPNEIELIKQHFEDRRRYADCRVFHFRVVRPNFDNGLTQEQKEHPSETALDDYPKIDCLIYNIGSLRDLKWEVMNTAWLHLL